MKQIKVIVVAIVFCFSAIFILLILRGFIESAKLPDLNLSHDPYLFTENFDYSNYIDFNDYLTDEKKHFEKVYAILESHSPVQPKYQTGSINHPEYLGENFNLSSLLYPKNGSPDSWQGAVLVIHGLSDSPYHMQHVANDFLKNGYIVLNLRLPGHGTAAGALVSISRIAWIESVKFSLQETLRQAQQTRGKHILAAGFSTGGALLIEHCLSRILNNDTPIPEKVFLFSPAASIDKMARLADYHELVSWLPGLEKFRWMDILDENDPYKYRSFPKNAAHQIYELTEHNKRMIDKVSHSEDLKVKMPPIICFQSPFDATAEFKGVINLYQKIAGPSSKLVLFKENELYNSKYTDTVKSIVHPADYSADIFSAKLYFIKNSNETSAKSALYDVTVAKNAFVAKQLIDAPSLKWPDNFFAMSHISIQIDPNDFYYGKNSVLYSNKESLYFGEYDLLSDETNLSRARWNPFYPIISYTIKQELSIAE